MTNTTEQKILNALSKSNEPICLSYTKQIKSLGFKHVIAPNSSVNRITKDSKKIKITGVSNVNEAFQKLF